MRKRIAFIMATVYVFLITGCGASNSIETPAGADSQIAENVGQKDTEGINTENTIDTEEPSWATGTQMEGKLFQNLNLDGVGDMPCQGLSVYFTGEKGQFQEMQRILYWTDNGWTIISEEV